MQEMVKRSSSRKVITVLVLVLVVLAFYISSFFVVSG